jgi:hypothetical protein
MLGTRSNRSLAPDTVVVEHSLAPQTTVPDIPEGGNVSDNDRGSGTETTGQRPEYKPFADALLRVMTERKLSASEVARRMWGTTVNTRGYTVARGRDRISHYLAGKIYPEPDNMVKLAEAIGVPSETLDVGTRTRAQPPPGAQAQSSPPTRTKVTATRRRMDLDLVPALPSPDAVRASASYHGYDLSRAWLIVNLEVSAAVARQIIAMLQDDAKDRTSETEMHVNEVSDAA